MRNNDRFPLEILGHIFRQGVLPRYPDFRELRMLYAPIFVCRSWYEAAILCSELWSKVAIALNDPSNPSESSLLSLKAFLERSGQTPLEVTVRNRNQAIPNKKLNFLIHEVHRWGTLSLELDKTALMKTIVKRLDMSTKLSKLVLKKPVLWRDMNKNTVHLPVLQDFKLYGTPLECLPRFVLPALKILGLFDIFPTEDSLIQLSGTITRLH